MSSEADRVVGRSGAARPPLWRRLALSWAERCRYGQVTLTFPDGESMVFTGSEPGPTVDMHLRSGRPVWQMLTRGRLGIAESYMDGDWTTSDLAELARFALLNGAALSDAMKGAWFVRLLSSLRFRLQANSRAGARRNIAHHYDLGNDFYAAWLDETMTYSSAVFADPEQSLADAQRNKYRQIIETLGIAPGDRVLEIGCGWGGFAETAAREAGARVTAITISKEQATFARDRMAAAGLADQVDIRLEDYRDTAGEFDKVVSIEMFEAVGEDHWPAFFEAVHDRMADGGRALLQVIVVKDEDFPDYRRRIDFNQRYIFPGGMLACPGGMAEVAARAGLTMGERRFFGDSYTQTLKRWFQRFDGAWPHIAEMGFDERFRRMWTYYLASCEASFATGYTNVGHFVFEKTSVSRRPNVG